MKKALFVFLVLLLLAAAGAVYYKLTHRVQGYYFNTKGVQLHYTLDGSGPPVILLHGFAVNADLNWRNTGITDTLSGNFKVIAMDLRGHGLSGIPIGEKMYGSKMVDDVSALMDHLGCEKAHLAGYSLGGFITLKFASKHPERLYSASVLASGWEPPENPKFMNAIGLLKESIKSGKSIGPLAEHLGSDRKPSFIHNYWVKLMTGYFNDRDAMVGVLGGLPQLALTKEQVKAIPVPMCSILGSGDILVPSAKHLNDAAGDHKLILIEGADHVRAPFKDEFHNAFSDFLKTHTPAD